MTKNFDFDPVLFLRCHSTTDKEAADVRVSVWQACFHPSSSNIVATCGGNKICLIDVLTGTVKQRYSGCNDDFFAITWIGDGKKDVLVAGGLRNKLYFVCPCSMKQLAFFCIPRTSNSKIIHSLVFNSGVLYCAMKFGGIHLIDVNLKSERDPEIQIKTTIRTTHEILKISISQDTRQLFCATDNGLFGCQLYDRFEKYLGTRLVEFCLPKKNGTNNDDMESKIVDSVEVINGGYIAAKCALHGVIYLWRSESTVFNGHEKVVCVTPTYILNWSSTDCFYMEISSNADILSCGDDEGNIWLYDIDAIKKGKYEKSQSIDPIKKIPWPFVSDIYHAKSKKLHLQVDNIIINKAVIDKQGQYMVAVTDRNTVCLWKRCSEQ